MFLSVFDLFKIGIGPSSSHTMGPMTAARRFLDEILADDWPRPAGVKVDRIGASLHGSLAYTGIGHGSDRAVILGLAGEMPQTVDPDEADSIVARIGTEKRISPPGHPAYRFDPAKDLVLDRKTPLTGHANGMAFYAYDASD
ncbi:MAG: L-serine ammonia-lyase, partial [Mesorhizobium sp.]